MMRRSVTLVGQLLMLVVSLFGADLTQRHVDVIPKALVRLPEVDYTRDDFYTVVLYFLAIHLVVLGIASSLLGAWRPRDTRRTVDELFVLGVGFALSALAVFITTTVSFDPQFIVAIVLWMMLLTIIIHFLARVSSKEDTLGLGAFLAASLRRGFSIPGILAVALALSPGVLAKLFVSNRDVANAITEVRIRLASTQSGEWGLVNALGGASFHQPMQVAFSRGAPGKVFVLERPGRILRADWPGGGNREVVLDITQRVGYVEVENGALGFDLHPRYGQSGDPQGTAAYLYYTSVIDGKQVNRLSRFDLGAGSDAQVAASEEVLILWDRRDDGFHNGGSAVFGPDGFLYVAVGEMSENDSHQRLDGALVSGILRLDVDRRGEAVSAPIRRQPLLGETRGYFIPSDNPYAGRDDLLGEYWAHGLRNPFRIAFDPADGALWAGDVGSTVWEEVNLIQRGRNYQFPFIEGNEATGIAAPASPVGDQKGPVYTYRHTAYDRAVIGGVVYRGRRFPELDGHYIFGDNYSGKVFGIPAEDDDPGEPELLTRANQFAQRGLTSFALSPDGELLLTTLGRATEASGEILKFVRGEGMTVATAPAPSAEVVSRAEAVNLFNTNCARCHGVTGRADGPDSGAMNVPVPDMGTVAFHASRTDAQLHDVVARGGAALGMSPMMPPWGELLSDAEIDAMVALIREFREAP